MADEMKATTTLDTSGKCCPMPMVETTKAIKALAPGEIPEIVATDIGTRRDIPSWCERSGNTLLSVTEQDKVLRYYVRKA
ncbi:MAG: sulfurtransferase TusA family protein [Burkholderiaceae bacterium]|nr:sulfurtransferase TusA family protein [Burkholderiaceae bacterium]